jgi:hypothetical protein
MSFRSKIENWLKFKMAEAAILYLGKVPTFDRDGIEYRVIPLLMGFLGRGVHFWC